MTRILLLAAALALVAVVAPADVSPVGEASAQCWHVSDEFQCVNPCYEVAAAYHRATGRTLHCTD